LPTAVTTRAEVTPRRSSSSIAARTNRVPIPCTSPERDTTCFDTQITNQGSEPSGFSCQVIAFGDTAATFADGAPTNELTLGSKETAHIGTIVTVHGDVEPVAPRVQCAPVET